MQTPSGYGLGYKFDSDFWRRIHLVRRLRIYAERSVLGCALHSDEAARTLVWSLTAVDYIRQDHGHIHTAIARLVGRGELADVCSVTRELATCLVSTGSTQVLPAACRRYVAGLPGPAAALLGYYIDVIKRPDC